MNLCLPIFIGSTAHQTPTQLAEKAIEQVSELRRYGKDKRLLPYAVGMDLAGRIVVDRLTSTPRREWLMNVTFKSDPDDLADEIRAEKEARA